ncbi:unnamed protein product [Didymodactylos carnosus]|uniref:Uncharacterized protein n=1 Tax=Didymodactylos carnosus TaxID=1234261 RepID=A0A813TYM9_9BILA|nr:unnamed protein product [Didymodactylos carnosus]CAF0820282.1 unnamed protein product [Didymodactylos carnosus]CAF3500508.1 unnamed protein product [Didymodactylos carnosus]CAF3606746.1 unnamed protein product [Didymodactylos carnosus]
MMSHKINAMSSEEVQHQQQVSPSPNVQKNHSYHSINDNSDNLMDIHSHDFARHGWHKVIAAIDEMRRLTECTKNQQRRHYALDTRTTPSSDMSTTLLSSQQRSAKKVESVHDELLFAKTGNFNLDQLSDDFSEMKKTFQDISNIKQENIQSVILATNLTKTALLIVFRSIESIAQVVTRGNTRMASFQTAIAILRAKREISLPGKLLCEWYRAAQTLDLLLNDPDWLCKRKKAKWAIEVCTETLIWSKGVFNENFKMAHPRPIFDRNESTDMATTKE